MAEAHEAHDPTPAPSHVHGHAHADPPERVRGRRSLLVAVLAVVVATVTGLVLLRPADVPTRPAPPETAGGTVVAARQVACNAELPGTPPTPSEHDLGPSDLDARCTETTVRVDDGPDAGRSFTTVTGEVRLAPGTAVRLASAGADVPFDARYEVRDAERSRPLLVLAALLLVVLVAVGRLRGLLALVGAGASVVVLLLFVVPALLSGRPPVATALVGAGAVMVVVLLLGHGPSLRTATALVGTTVALLVTTGLGAAFTSWASLTGLSSDESAFVQASFPDVELRGLLLAGMVIGALGILDDVTVTQVSTVYELRAADPTMPVRRLYQAALRVGRDHIASAVNTLLLAYAGAGMPLLVVLATSGEGLGATLTNGVVAEEVVRTLVGSVGLVLAVPVTTALAAVTCPAREPRDVGRHAAPAG